VALLWQPRAGSSHEGIDAVSVLAVGWLLLAGVVWSDFKPEDNAAIMAKGKNLWVATYLRTRDLNAANQAARFSIYSLDPASPVIAGRLRWLDQRHLSFFRVPPDKK